MVLDPQLLDKARLEGQKLAEAERQAVTARADYYSAIRRLHLAGSPLREIGQALELSHQRVQQIVDEAGGSWWQRLRGRKPERVAICTFCDRPPAEVQKLIAGPDVFICDLCITRAERIVAGRPSRGETWSLDAGPQSRCSFCNLKRSKVHAMVGGPASICDQCLTLCRQIIGDSVPQ